MSGYSVKGSGSNFYVVRGDETVMGPFQTVWRAEDIRDELIRKEKRKVRPCITCETDFESEGPHNRMCDACREEANDMGMVA